MLWVLSMILLVIGKTEGISTKKGICVSTKYYRCDDLIPFDGVYWWNDWSLTPGYLKKTTCTNTPSQERVPMVWGWWRGKTLVGKVPDSSKYLIGFNEPNHKEQSNITAANAAKYWKEVMNAAGNKLLVSPSAAPCGGGNQKCWGTTEEWFDEFFKLCEGCRFDFLSTHHYSCNPQSTITFLKNLYDRYKLPIWLTEFSCPQTTDVNKILSYMKGVLPLLEEAPYVFRYSWFTHRREGDTKWVTSATSLVEPNTSTLTVLGKCYNSFQPGVGCQTN